jgi:hypothetical protein
LAPKRRVESYDRERIQTLLIFSLAKSAGNHSCGQHTSCPVAVSDVHVSFYSLCFPKPMPWKKNDNHSRLHRSGLEEFMHWLNWLQSGKQTFDIIDHHIN